MALSCLATLFLLLITQVSVAEDIPQLFVNPRYTIKKELDTKTKTPVYNVQNIKGDSDKKSRSPSSDEVISNNPSKESLIEKQLQKEAFFQQHDPNLAPELRQSPHYSKRVELTGLVLLNTINAFSNYSYREFHTSYQSLELGARVHISNAVEFGAAYEMSLGADLDSDPSNRSKTPVRFTNFESHLSYGGTQNLYGSPLRFLGLYVERRAAVPKDETFRMGLKTSGIGIGIEALIHQQSEERSRFLFSFFPNVQHSEDQTGTTAFSGNHRQSTLLSLTIERGFFSQGESELFWQLRLYSERNFFEGSTILPDPKSGTTPNNVSVNSTTLQLSLGYRWGR